MHYFVSYPKSGRTWLRVMVGKAICGLYGLDESEVLKTESLCKKVGVPPWQWTHQGAETKHLIHPRDLEIDISDPQKSKVIFLTRDVRDLLVSSYFQAT